MVIVVFSGGPVSASSGYLEKKVQLNEMHQRHLQGISPMVAASHALSVLGTMPHPVDRSSVAALGQGACCSQEVTDRV